MGDSVVYVTYYAPVEGGYKASINFSNRDGDPWFPPHLSYGETLRIAIRSGYKHFGTGDSFEFQAVNFNGQFSFPDQLENAAYVERSFFKGDHGKVYYDPSKIRLGGSREEYINVTLVQGDKIVFEVTNNNSTGQDGFIDFLVTVMDTAGGATNNHRYVSDPRIPLEKEN